MVIQSVQNARIKRIVKLKDRRARDQEKIFIIEGKKAISLALQNNVAIHEIYYCAEIYRSDEADPVITRAKSVGANVYQTSESVFLKIAYKNNPEGIIATASQFNTDFRALKSPNNALFLVAQAIEKPGNLGTMLRTADAAKANGVIVCDAVTDIYNPNVVRASQGTLFTVPIYITSTADFLQWKQTNGVQLVATTPAAVDMFTDIDLTQKTAIAIGAEQPGLPDHWLDNADKKVLIPMYGQADSLNASVSAALVMYEAVRQRRATGLLS